jgi:hypothetical protein
MAQPSCRAEVARRDAGCAGAPPPDSSPSHQTFPEMVGPARRIARAIASYRSWCRRSSGRPTGAQQHRGTVDEPGLSECQYILFF